jgi:hypothetical protein
VISNQRLLIQAEKSYASYQRAITKDFNRYHMAKWISSRPIDSIVRCLYHAAVFDEEMWRNIDTSQLCQLSFANSKYHFLIEHLDEQRCLKNDDKFYIIDYYQLILIEDAHQKALHHIFYKAQLVTACDYKLSFVIKSHLPSTWFIR